MVIIRDIDSSKDVVKPIEIEYIYGEEAKIFVVPELDLLAKLLVNEKDPTSDSSLALIWEMSADYLRSIGYTDDRFRTRRDIIFIKNKPTDSYFPECDVSGCCSLLLNKIEPPYAASIIDRKIVSAATAKKVNGIYELTVETAPAYRGNGYAKRNVCALSDRLIREGERVRYLCSDNNIASVSVALGSGFEKSGVKYEYTVRKGINHGI